MSDLAIKVENISKAYRIGLKEKRHDTLGAALVAWVKSPLQNFRKLKSLTHFNHPEDADIFWALRDISFEVRKGEVLGIIGKNGAGKSTLLKILSRITEPTGGRIEIYGRVSSLLEVGTGFNPELTGRENVYLNGTILGMTKKEIDGRFEEIIDFSGIEKFIDTPVKRYSSGMKVRLAFAVAAHLESEILIVDEVLAVGDAEFQKKCLGKMEEISKGEGKTVLFVSHNMSAVSGLCNKGMVLKNGILQFEGSIQPAVQEYLKQYNNETKQILYKPENAPGNEYARLISANIATEIGNEILRVDDNLKINFEMQLAENIKNDILDITFHLKDELGSLVFVGSTAMHEKSSGNFKRTASCSIPKRLMNTGSYNIQRLLLVKNRGQVLVEFKDVIQFELMDEEKQELGWKGQKEGAVKPYLEWTVE